MRKSEDNERFNERKIFAPLTFLSPARRRVAKNDYGNDYDCSFFLSFSFSRGTEFRDYRKEQSMSLEAREACSFFGKIGAKTSRLRNWSRGSRRISRIYRKKKDEPK